ncbi:MAG: hypothetical protein V3571_03985 [Pseudodesulfovibrio sp.]
MNKCHRIAALVVACVVFLACRSVACETSLSCDGVQQIYVGKGRRHLAGGQTESVYAVGVLVDAAAGDLKKAYADCPGDIIVIRVGDGVFTLPKSAVSPAGNWFGLDRRTPEEALDAAMSICPDKVKSYLDE